MKLGDILTLSTRMFTTRLMRTILTILGVSIGIGAVLFLVSLGYGMQRVILSQITSADTLLSLDVSPGSSALIALNQKNIDKMSLITGVTEIARTKSFSGQIEYLDLTSDTIIRTIDPPFFRLNGTTVSFGELFQDNNEYNIVITAAVAKLLNIPTDEIIGKEINVTISTQLTKEVTDPDQTPEMATIDFPKTFIVKGIIDDATSSVAYIPLGLAQGATDIADFDLIKVKMIDQTVASSVREQILNQGFVVTALSDVIDQANKIFSILQIVLGLFGLIALVVSAIGMFNTMTIALLERINEIGIMRSVGVTRGDIRKMFIIEAMIMGFSGGVVGVFLGYLAGLLANIAINILAKNFGGQTFDLFYQPLWFVVVIISFSTLVGFLTGLFPSRRAANLDPLEALRYK